MRRVAAFVSAPSIDSSLVIDALEWEMYIARYHASASNTMAMGFCLLYNLFYVPTELGSLHSFSQLYYNMTSAALPNSDQALPSSDAFDDFTTPAMVYNLVSFYHGRIISRFFLVLFMAFCVGSFISCRICIPDSIFRSYFQDYMFKELRGLRDRDAHFQTLLMRRLINADPPLAFAARNLQPSEDSVSFLGATVKLSVVLPYVALISNPVFFFCAYIPNCILRAFFERFRRHPQPFVALQHACVQVVIYNDSIRRSAKVPALLGNVFCIITSRFVPRCLFLAFCGQETSELLREVDSIFDSFAIEQRVHLYHALMCHSNVCVFVASLVCMSMFLQNAFCSELVVAWWFSIPNSQKQASPSDATFRLFHNYEELVNWEYLVNSHFIFFIFFAVNLTCSNATMLRVLAPSFLVTAAGLYSNHGTTIDLTSIDSWFIICIVVSYCLSFITNALTYRNIFDMFVNRTNDLTFVSDNTMLEMSHEFMSLGHISLEALRALCDSTAPSHSERVQCMMWLLRKQRFNVQQFRPVSFDVPSMLAIPRDVSIRRLLREEFEVGHQSVPPKFGHVTCFKSVCKLFQCDVEFRIDLSDDVDLMVRGVESEMKHFLCSFLFSVLMNAYGRAPSDTALLKICVSISACQGVNLDSVFTHDNQASRRGSIELSAAAPRPSSSLKPTLSLHDVCPVRIEDPDGQYLQFVAEVVNSAPLPHTRDRPSWISKFFDLDNFSVIEFATRMKGSVQISRSDGGHRVSEFDHLGAFALPCVSSTISAKDESDLPIPLRLLILEDKPAFAAKLIAKIRQLPLAEVYIIDHENNVSDALVKFSNAKQNHAGQVYDSNRTYDVLLIDLFMPMEPGAAEDSQAGVCLDFCCTSVNVCLCLFVWFGG
jgi:hypothetical protein